MKYPWKGAFVRKDKEMLGIKTTELHIFLYSKETNSEDGRSKIGHSERRAFICMPASEFKPKCRRELNHHRLHSPNNVCVLGNWNGFTNARIANIIKCSSFRFVFLESLTFPLNFDTVSDMLFPNEELGHRQG